MLIYLEVLTNLKFIQILISIHIIKLDQLSKNPFFILLVFLKGTWVNSYIQPAIFNQNPFVLFFYMWPLCFMTIIATVA